MNNDSLFIIHDAFLPCTVIDAFDSSSAEREEGKKNGQSYECI